MSSRPAAARRREVRSAYRLGEPAQELLVRDLDRRRRQLELDAAAGRHSGRGLLRLVLLSGGAAAACVVLLQPDADLPRAILAAICTPLPFAISALGAAILWRFRS